MKQVIQSYRTGALELAEVPAPASRRGRLLVQNVRSVLSVGTERSMLDLARKSLLGKALARPDLVQQVVHKVRAEGLAETYRQAMGRLEDPVPLGYSSSGIVLEVGAGVGGYAVGDHVACSGFGHACHAEIVSVPRNLVVKIPDEVDFDQASFVTLGAIALHAVRTSEPGLGDRALVIGLGLLGLLAVQILKAAGCRILAADLDPGKVALARKLGADMGVAIGDDVLTAARSFSGGPGADLALIFAASESNEPIELAACCLRDRGRLVVPGTVGLDLPRKLFYEKELSFVVSRAWGPGMYDPDYEVGGVDYPLPFVRWTAQRNMGHFLELVAEKKTDLTHLITHRYPIERAVDAYERILAGTEPCLGVLLTYPEVSDLSRSDRLGTARTAPPEQAKGFTQKTSSGPAPLPEGDGGGKTVEPLHVVRLGLIGAGLFAKGTVLPALRRLSGFELVGVATATGLSGQHVGRKHGFSWSTTETSKVIEDPGIDLVLVLTRHGSHAGLASRALRAGKHVFVEKPLALDEEQLAEVMEAYTSSPGQLIVGFNRRFSPTVREAVKLLQAVQEPLMISMRVNAGYVPPGSWVHDPEEGGGRIVGEACHFVDLAQALARARPVTMHAECVKSPAKSVIEEDNVFLTVGMSDGSVASIAYTSGGDKAFSRERVEVFGGGASCVIENFRRMTWTRNGKTRKMGSFLRGVDRGHRAEFALLLEALRQGRAFPVPFEEYVATTRSTFAALESLRTGRTVPVEWT